MENQPTNVQNLIENNEENNEVLTVKFEDLVVAKKNEKLAIFNKENSTYLTEYEFDRILLSESGHHIVYRSDDLIDEDGRLLKHWGTITYSAVVDNYGNVKEFEDIDFGYNGSFVGDICPALYKKTGKVHLVDYNKGVISEGFKRIVPLDRKNLYGIYRGLEYDEELKTLALDKLIFEDGSIIDVNIEDSSAVYQTYQITDIKTFDDMIELIKKYGANIIELTPYFVFTKLIDFHKILLTVNEFYPQQLGYVIDFLSEHIEHLNFEKKYGILKDLDEENSQNMHSVEENNDLSTYKLTSDCFNCEILKEEINFQPRIFASSLKIKIDKLYDKYKLVFWHIS